MGYEWPRHSTLWTLNLKFPMAEAVLLWPSLECSLAGESIMIKESNLLLWLWLPSIGVDCCSPSGVSLRD